MSAPTHPLQLRIVGPFRAMTGYSKMTRAVLRCALLAGFEVEAVESDYNERTTGYVDGRVRREKVLPVIKTPLPEEQEREVMQAFETQVDADAPTLLIQLPDALYSWPQYQSKATLGWTMTESDNLCASWRHGCRNVDLLLAPSQYCHDTFKRVIPEVASVRLPIPVDERLWSAEEEYVEEVRGRPPFLFLWVGQTSERKQWRVLMQAFAEEFAGESDKVGLLVRPSRWPEVEQMADWCRTMGAWVHLDDVNYRRTDWTMAALYRACQVVVQPSSEGFGLPYVEAGLCGRPSVALSLGGAADVVNEDCGYVVPSRMEPLIGHMPHVYPRQHHKFAVCDIDDLRATLRRAYETEMAGQGKGPAALESARRFTCKAIAPMLAEVVDRGRKTARWNREVSGTPGRPLWAFVAGAWGDVMCACGKIAAMVEALKVDTIGVIYYGRDPKIGAWLAQQTWCREVVALVEPDQQTMSREFALACQCKPIHAKAWLAGKLARCGHSDIDISTVAFTQLRLNMQETPKYWSGARLSPAARMWAQEHAEEISQGGAAFLLLNPLSVASNQMKDHWPFWSEAMTWLLDRARQACVRVVLTGEKRIPWPECPALVNLSGESRSMEDVLALAERASGMVTTSNNLGIYAAIADIPSVVVCARTCGEETFYHRWMERAPIRLVEHGDALPQFMETVEALLADLGLFGDKSAQGGADLLQEAARA